MDANPARVFAHRIAKDGAIESICMTCFITVSRTWGHFRLTEEELRQIESIHVCEQRRLLPTILQ